MIIKDEYFDPDTEDSFYCPDTETFEAEESTLKIVESSHVKEEIQNEIDPDPLFVQGKIFTSKLKLKVFANLFMPELLLYK